MADDTPTSDLMGITGEHKEFLDEFEARVREAYELTAIGHHEAMTRKYGESYVEEINRRYENMLALQAEVFGTLVDKIIMDEVTIRLVDGPVYGLGKPLEDEPLDCEDLPKERHKRKAWETPYGPPKRK